MKLVRLSLTNFGSFRGQQDFLFPEQTGLYFMTGVNEVEPRLEANGCGKSTLWSALTWCLYGKTSRGLKAGDICNWGVGKGAVVELAYKPTDGMLNVMRRTWAPNTWTLQDLFGNTTDLVKEESNAVLAEIRLEFTSFLNCVVMAQGQPMFLDLRADAKAALFADIMGLDKWLGFSEVASEKARQQEGIVSKWRREVDGLEGQLDGLGNEDLEKKLDDWEYEHRKAIEGVEDDHAAEVIHYKKCKAVIMNAVKDYESKQKDVDHATKEVADCKDGLHACLQTKDDWLREAKRIDDDFFAIDAERKAVGKRTCPMCGQDLHGPTLNELEGNLAKRVNEVLMRRTKNVDQLAGLKAPLDDWQRRVDVYKQDLYGETLLLTQARNKLDDCEADKKESGRKLDALEAKLDFLLHEKNPFLGLQGERKSRLSELRADVKHASTELDDANYWHSIYQYWVKGFKELRLQLINEALIELEIEVNSCVESLGLVGWQLNFQVDRETKSGSIQRGFNVVVTSPHNSVAVPWEAWSGGEAQRLRVATNMGLADLIRARTGSNVDVEVWDEPTAGLSPQGVQDLLEAMATRARIEDRQIFVVDHRSHSFGDFAGIYLIRKTAKGSVIEVD